MKISFVTYTQCPVRPYQCYWDACSERFERGDDLEKHYRTHTNGKLYACSSAGCGKSFKRNCDLQRHYSKHTKDKPFPCTVPGCEKRFTQKYAAIVHVRGHDGEKYLQCQQTGCGMRFSHPSSLARHRRIRTKERRYQCNVDGCGGSFCNFALLFRHQWQLHPQEMNTRHIDDGSSGSDDQESVDLQQWSNTSSPDDMFSIGQTDPKYLLNYEMFDQNLESQVHSYYFPPHQEYTTHLYETGYPDMDGGALAEVESPGMEVDAADGTKVWFQSCVNPSQGPSFSSWTAQGGFFSPGTLPMHPVAEDQAGMLQYQQPMQSHMVYLPQEQWPPYEFLAF